MLPLRTPAAAFAAAALAAAALAAPASAQTWTAVADASRLGFVADLQGSPVTGAFERFDAAITLDPEAPEAGAIVITVDVSSVVTDNDQANAAVASADWFAADAFGQAVFASETIVGEDVGETGGAYVAQGVLTIRDAAVPVSLPFTLTVTGETATATGALTLDRTAFGIGQGAWAAPQPVAHEVAVTFEIVAARD